MPKFCSALCAILVASLPAHAAKLKVLYSLSAAEGAYPTGHLSVDANGNILGMTTSGGANNQGTVFALMPPAQGGTAWQLKVLHSFTVAEGPPNIFSGVTIAPNGTAYGVTAGTVFSLAPLSAAGTSSYANLLSFSTYLGHPIIPSSSLLIGGGGALYVTDEEGGPNFAGAVYRISNSTTGWSFSDIHDFARTDGFYPKGNIILDGNGNIYGTTQSGGIYTDGNVYELTPPTSNGAWSIKTLATFAHKGGNEPDSGIVWGANSTIYGTTSETGFTPRGSLFSLSQNGNAWALSQLVSSRALYGSNMVLPKADGTLLTANGNTIQSLAPANGAWAVQRVAKLPDRSASFGPPVAGPGGTYYLTTSYGSMAPLGRIFALTP